MRRLWFIPFLLLTGCATIHTERIPLLSEANTCQISEARPSWLSTLTVGVCWGADGQVIGMTGTGGKPMIAVPLDAAQALAAFLGPGVAAYILGTDLIKVGQTGLDVRHSGTVKGAVTGTGTVTGTVSGTVKGATGALTVSPVTP